MEASREQHRPDRTGIALLLALLIVSVAMPAAAARVDVSGPLTSNATWTATNVYVLTGDVTVNAGVTLTVQPGTVVKGGGGLWIVGSLFAEGTSVSPIAFTSYYDDSRGGDTNGDGAASAPAPGQWRGLIYQAGSHGRISNASVSYAGCGGYCYGKGLIETYTSDLKLEAVVLEFSGRDGLNAVHASPAVLRCTVRNNGAFGLHFSGLDPAVPLAVTDNLFTSTGGGGGLLAFDGEPTAVATFRGNRSTDGKCAFSVQGTANGDLVWDNGDDLPLYLNDDFAVAASRTLTLMPGTVVKVAYRGLYVDGFLFAEGTESAPIAFTSLYDDTVGGDTNADGAASTPGPGQWRGVIFRAGSFGRISEASVSYGGCGGYCYGNGAVESYSSGLQLDRVLIRKSLRVGLYAKSVSPTVRNCTIANNTGFGMRFDGLDTAFPLTVTDTIFTSAGGGAGLIAFDGLPTAPITFRGNRSSDGRCAFSVQGTANGDLVWDNGDDLPLYLNEDFAVAATRTLTLMPGTVVKASYRGLYLDGTLVAEGAPEAPVAFTSLQDDSRGGDTNADGAASSPAPGQWRGVYFRAGSHGRVSNASFSYGGCGGYCYGRGLVVSASNDVHLDGVLLEKSGREGIYGTESGMTVKNSSIVGSATGVLNESAKMWLDARFSWWGDATGPYHPTRNPNGKGQPVSDMVLFFPWALDAEGTTFGKANVIVDGPSRVSAGQTVQYAVTYETGEDPLQDAVLAVSIPLSANLEECGTGTWLQESSEVFWLLGDLPAFSSGTRTLRVTYMWGVPNGFDDGLTALLVSNSLDTGSYAFDPARYSGYTPVTSGTPVPLSDIEIQAELASHPEFKALHDLALSRGFTRLGGAIETVDGVPYTFVRLASYALGSVAELLRSRADDRSVLRTYGPQAFTVEDASGGLTLNLELDSATFTGSWEPSEQAGGEANAISKEVAFRNCLLMKGGNWALGKISKVFKAVTGGYKCAKGLLAGDPGGLSDCLGLIEKVKETVPIYGEIKLFHTCYWDTIVGGQVAKYTCEGSLYKVEPPSIGFNPVSWTEEGRRRMYVKYKCDPTTNMWTKPDYLYCLKGYVAQEGALDEFGHPCVPANEVQVAPPKKDDEKVPSKTRSTAVRVAKDPNAKHGPAGEVLATDELDYAVEFENVGDGTAYGVFITDTLSELLDDSTLSLQDGGSYAAGSRMIFWDVGDLAPKGENGSKGEVHFSVKLKPGTPSGTTVTNKAVVYFPSVPEETPTNSVVNTVASVLATPQEVEMTAGGTLPIALAGRSAAGAALEFAVTALPLFGELTGTPPALNYKPSAGFTGGDRFLFTVADPSGTSAPAEVSVLVKPDPNDRTPPTVTRTSPTAGQSVEATTSPAFSDDAGPVYPPTVEVGFSEVLDASTVTADTVELRDGGGSPVDRSVAYDAQSGSCRITSRAPWSFGTYSATVKTGVKDLNGNSLGAPYTWTFTTFSGAPITAPGDCDASGSVSIGEVQKAINMFLGTFAPGCGVDCNGDGTVSIGEVQKVINAFLGLPSSC